MAARGLDANDLHVEFGIDFVRAQLTAALAANDSVDVASPAPSDVEPDAVVPELPDDGAYEARIDLDGAIERFALAMPDGKVWDTRDRQLLKVTAARAMMGPKLYKEWLEHDDRRTIDQTLVMPLARAAAAAVSGGGGLAGALQRYIYLYPTTDAWDTAKQCEVPLSALKHAIADCFDDWIKHPNRREIDRDKVVFDPTQRCDPSTHINTFRGIEMKPVADLDACRAIRALVWHLCNENNEVFEWLIRWMAYPLQHVGAKMATAVLMHSHVHGSGKSLLFEGVLKAIYGEFGSTLGQHQLESQYTDWRSQLLFGLFEEIFSRDQKYQHTGTLKHMITGSTQRIEKKFVSGWEEANHMNAVFLSNEIQPFPIEPSDRRFLVVWPRNPLPERMQAEVTREIENGGVAAFYGWLLSLDTSEFGPHTKPPMTRDKQRLIDFGLPGWQVFYEEWRAGNLEAPFMPAPAALLFKVYRQWCEGRRENVVSMTKFGGFLAVQDGLRRRRDLHYTAGQSSRKSTFFIPRDLDDEWKQGESESQGDWLGRCYRTFELRSGVDE